MDETHRSAFPSAKQPDRVKRLCGANLCVTAGTQTCSVCMYGRMAWGGVGTMSGELETVLQGEEEEVRRRIKLLSHLPA